MVRGTGREHNGKEQEGPPPFDALALQVPEAVTGEATANKDIGESAICGVGLIIEADGEKISLVAINNLPFPDDPEMLYCLLGRCRDDLLLKIVKGAL